MGVNLSRLFDEYNKTYFNGELRKYHVTFKRLPGNSKGRCESKERTIYLQR